MCACVFQLDCAHVQDFTTKALEASLLSCSGEAEVQKAKEAAEGMLDRFLQGDGMEEEEEDDVDVKAVA